jgi:hypothetical protein
MRALDIATEELGLPYIFFAIDVAVFGKLL